MAHLPCLSTGERIDGAVPESQLWAVIDRALRDEGVPPPPPEAPDPQAKGKTAGAN